MDHVGRPIAAETAGLPFDRQDANLNKRLAEKAPHDQRAGGPCRALDSAALDSTAAAVDKKTTTKNRLNSMNYTVMTDFLQFFSRRR